MQRIKENHIKASCAAKSPLDLIYMKGVITSLDLMGAWPHAVVSKPRKERFMNSFLITWETSFFTLGILYLVQNQSWLSYFELGHMYISLLMNGFSLIRLYVPWSKSYKMLAKDLVDNFHLMYFKHKSEYAMKIFLQVETICKIVNIILHSQLFIGLLLYNVTPFYNNYSKGLLSSNRPENATFEHTVNLALPFDVYTNIYNYYIMAAINIFATVIVATSFCSNDLYLSILIFQIWGHLKILLYNLEHFPLPKNHNSDNQPFWYNEEERKNILLMLKENINHHILITRFVKRLSSAFGLSIGIYYVFHQVIGCILLLEVSSMNPEAFGKYGPLTLTLFQLLIQISVLFEILNSMSGKLMKSVYMVPFEYMDYKEMKAVQILIVNSQTEFTMKGAGIVPIGVNTMATILKNTLSYYVVLNALAKS